MRTLLFPSGSSANPTPARAPARVWSFLISLGLLGLLSLLGLSSLLGLLKRHILDTKSRKSQKTQKTRKTQKTQKIKVKDSKDPSYEVRPFLNRGLPNEIVGFQLKSGVCGGGGQNM